MLEKADGKAPFVFELADVGRLVYPKFRKLNRVQVKRWNRNCNRFLSKAGHERQFWYNRSGFTADAWIECVEDIVEHAGEPFRFNQRRDPAWVCSQLFAADMDLRTGFYPHPLALRMTDHLHWNESYQNYSIEKDEKWPFTFSPITEAYPWLKVNLVPVEDVERMYVEHHGQLKYARDVAWSGKLVRRGQEDRVI